MEWFIVLSLIGLGLLLIIVEVIFIPGTTVAGFIGFGLLLSGIVLSFRYFNDTTGWFVLGGTAAVSLVVFVWMFTAKPWKLFSLKTAIKSKVNEGTLDGLEVGQEGVTVSALRPRGNAEIGDKTIEVTTFGSFLDSGTRIKIIKISLNQILVEPIN